MLRTSSLRVLARQDQQAVRALLDADPVANVFVASRLEAVGLNPSRLGAEVWGHLDDGGFLDAVCYSGANLVPCCASEAAARAFADKARRQGRRCSSILGPRDAVTTMWETLRHSWGDAREVRPRQPLLVTARPPSVPVDHAVRRVRPDELEIILPACIEMFTEEVGVSPLAGDGGELYRARVRELVEQGRSFARIEGDRVLFKAEIGASTRDACQVQGVWVAPSRRGSGLGTAGTAAVTAAALSSIAPAVSLYVNDFNVAARRVYERVGYREVGVFTSVLF